MKNNFAENFKQLRLSGGYKQADIARRLNTTQRRISYWESGRIEPDLDSLLAIAVFFDITLDELLGKI